MEWLVATTSGKKQDGVWKSVEKSTRCYTLNLEMNGTSMFYTFLKPGLFVGLQGLPVIPSLKLTASLHLKIKWLEDEFPFEEAYFLVLS